MIDTKVYTKSSSVEIINHEDRFLLVNKNANSWIRTNESGMNIFNKIDGNIAFNELLNSLAEEYEIDVTLIKEDIMTFLDNCIEKSLIVEKGNVEVDNKADTLQKQLEEIPFIEEVVIKVIDKCNLDCIYCPSRSSITKSNNTSMNLDDFTKVVKDIRTINATNIVLTGGEPLLKEDIVDFCRISKESGHRTTINTNLLTEDTSLLKQIIKHVDHIIVSIDGYDELTNSKIRGKGNFDKVLENIRFIKEQGFSAIGFSYAPNKINKISSDHIVDITSRLNLRELIINRILPMSPQIDKDIILSTEEFTEVYKVIKESFRKYMKKQIDGSITRGVEVKWMGLKLQGFSLSKINSEGFVGHSCGLGIKKMSIEGNGDVYPCRLLHNSEFLVGNAINESFNAIYEKSKKEYSAVITTDLEECGECKFNNFCDKGCRASSYYSANSINKKDDLCEILYESIDNILFGY